MTVRRQLITSPGQALFPTTDPMSVLDAHNSFAQLSGVPVPQLEYDPCCVVPVPVTPAQWPNGRKRWEGVKPSFMCHPLMWLPTNLSTLVVDERCGLSEDPAAHVARVMVEVTRAGLYDVESGTWEDVLEPYGFDVLDPAHQARIGVWLAGGEDKVLDSVDLTGRFNEADPSWAMRELVDYLPLLWAYSTYHHATYLADETQLIVGGFDEYGARANADAVASLAGLADICLTHAFTGENARDLFIYPGGFDQMAKDALVLAAMSEVDMDAVNTLAGQALRSFVEIRSFYEDAARMTEDLLWPAAQ